MAQRKETPDPPPLRRSVATNRPRIFTELCQGALKRRHPLSHVGAHICFFPFNSSTLQAFNDSRFSM
jgi:hypothetical protein